MGTRKASCIIQSEFEDLRTRGTDDAEGLRTWNSTVRGHEKMADSAQEERKNLPFLGLFVLFGSTDWMMPAHNGEGRSFLLSPIQTLISSRKVLTDTLRNVLPAI